MTVSTQILVELWQEIKPFFATSDRPEAAETFVNVLIDNDMDPKELKKAFKKDGNILNALGLHDDISDYEDTDEDDDDEDELDFEDD